MVMVVSGRPLMVLKRQTADGDGGDSDGGDGDGGDGDGDGDDDDVDVMPMAAAIAARACNCPTRHPPRSLMTPTRGPRGRVVTHPGAGV